MKKSILVFLTASMLVFSVFTAGCSGTASNSSSTSISSGSDSGITSGTSSGSASNAADASSESVLSASSDDVFQPESVSAESVDTESVMSSSEDIPGKATDLSIILEEIRITVMPGTAGSSLGCARAASDLLNFTNSTSMTSEEIQSGVENYRSTLSEDDRTELTDQFELLRETVSSFQSESEDTIRDELSDAGVEDSDCPWTPAAYEKALALLDA